MSNTIILRLIYFYVSIFLFGKKKLTVIFIRPITKCLIVLDYYVKNSQNIKIENCKGYKLYDGLFLRIPIIFIKSWNDGGLCQKMCQRKYIQSNVCHTIIDNFSKDRSSESLCGEPVICSQSKSTLSREVIKNYIEFDMLLLILVIYNYKTLIESRCQSS